MSSKFENMLIPPEAQVVILEAALNAVAAGDATISENEIRWEEECRQPGVDTMIGVTRCEGRWVPLVEMGPE